MAKGLNINAVPFEPGTNNTTHLSGYLQAQGYGPSLSPMQVNPNIYFRPAHPYDGSMYQYGSLEPHHVQSAPMYYYGPNYSVMPQAPCHWPIMQQPPPQPLPPPSQLPRPPQPAASRRQRNARNGTVLKVLTSAPPAASAAGVNDSQPSQRQTMASARANKSPTAAPAVAAPVPLLAAVAKAIPGTLQLSSAEDFPELGGATAVSAKIAQQANAGKSLGKNSDSSGPAHTALSLSYSAAIKQPRPNPASLAPHPAAPHPTSNSEPGQSTAPLGRDVASDATTNSESAAKSRQLQQKQKQKQGGSKKRRSKTKKKKKKKTDNEKQQTESVEQAAIQQPAFQFEQEDFPTLQVAPPQPPPAQHIRVAGSQQQNQQPMQPSMSSVARKQQVNRAVRQSLLLSSSLLVVNKAIVVASNQRTSAGTSAGGGGGAAAVHSTAPLRVGKQRERPRAKKKSLTKKIILLERQARRKVATTAAVAAASVCSDKEADKNGAADEASSSDSSEPPPPPPPPPPPQPPSQPPSQASKSLHSRRFREYCDQLIVKSVQELSIKVLRDLVFYQARAQARDPAKAKQKRRLVMGLREARKHIGLNRIRLVFISPDLERVQTPGGLDDSINQLIVLCQQRCVPYVFGLKRREMGRVLRKSVPVSVVAVFDYQGCEASVNALLELVRKAKADYQTLSRMALECGRDEDPTPVAKDADVASSSAAATATTADAAEESPTSAGAEASSRPATAHHSRNPSDTSNAVSEPISELDAAAPSAGRPAGSGAVASSSQLYGFHSRQSSLGVVVIAQTIDEFGGQGVADAVSDRCSDDKVANWLSSD